VGKVEGYFFGIIGVFLVGADIVYWFMSGDPTGTTCIALAACLAALCTFYLSYTARRTGPRPEDRPDADITEGAGEVGHFSPGSPWPIAMALSANMLVMGFVFGLWISFIAAAGLLFSIVGLVFEHYRGNNLYTEDAIGIDPISII
jgi:hypothetical protein